LPPPPERKGEGANYERFGGWKKWTPTNKAKIKIDIRYQFGELMIVDTSSSYF